MFENLSEKLQRAFKNLRGQGTVTEENMQEALREIRVALLGKDTARFQFASRPPTVILMAGLQGSGKTTTSGKLAAWLQKGGHRPMLVSVDVYRPAAREQLKVVANSIKAKLYEGDTKGKPAATPLLKRPAKEARREAVISGCNTLIVDTAGRLHVDTELMD